LSGEFPSGFFRVEGNFKINSKFLKISVSLFFILMKSGNFFLGFDLISSSIKGSFDFVSFKSFDTFLEMVIKSIEHSSNFIVEGVKTLEANEIKAALDTATYQIKAKKEVARLH
jgi:hypothetical protein